MLLRGLQSQHIREDPSFLALKEQVQHKERDFPLHKLCLVGLQLVTESPWFPLDLCGMVVGSAMGLLEPNQFGV